MASFGSDAIRTAGPPSNSPQMYIDQAGTANVWSVDGDKFMGCPGAQKRLDPAFYSCGVDNYGRPFLSKMSISIDSLIRLPDPVTDMLLAEFVGFWGRADKMISLGLSVKRGLMLYGPPGSGKTSAIQQMAAHMITEMGGAVIMAARPEVTAACLHILRKIEPDRPVIVLYEDMDSLVENFGEAGYLALLDGETQISNVVNVATTNYPERLDRRFVDRPGRFDRITYVGMPSAEARDAYLKARAPELDELTRRRWVTKSEDWSIAHLRELIVATQVLGEGDNETIERLNGMREELANSEKTPDAPRLGFGN